ncbi:WD40-like Beta Propeller Repeat [Caldanaerobius fijiensis DSM 17918]|uniref:WD40-like Beta Propeller Repeat n=1 Tax=Caldanaerobius fijiensis DSM 17918 TaxID=1121256 RepID=A0A1M5BJN7_9THEO|nr:PD40 domain-containing protein [Caldanaerobius fijiensis]SHF42560.1 WD40-like Beta Propeller Repeat [Caldanaerobius fijiensis DSM 17918]
MKDFATGKTATLVYNNAGNFDVSQDGKMIVYASKETGQWQIYKAIVDGNKLSNIFMLSDGISRSEDPRLSWDGKKVVYKRNNNIVVCDLNGTIIQQITNASDIENWAPCFAPDGRIAFTRCLNEDSKIVIWDGSKEFEAASGWYPAFGEDNSLYFVNSPSSGEDNICCISPKSTSLKVLPINAYRKSNADPHWVLGTNNLLTFTSDRDGGYAGYIADLINNKVFKIVSDDSSPVLNPIAVVKNIIERL